jgi:hypothetical protein
VKPKIPLGAECLVWPNMADNPNRKAHQVSTKSTLPSATPRTPPNPSLNPNDAPRSEPAPVAIGSLVCDLAMLTSALERHVADMNYCGTDEFNAHTFPRHPFDDDTYEILYDLAERVQQLGNDLYSAEQERRSYASLTPEQQTARTQDLEQAAEHTQAEQRSRAEWQQGAAARETAWAALPPESTAPGRCNESVKRCAKCGGRVNTIDGIRRCWACFRRDQDGR